MSGSRAVSATAGTGGRASCRAAGAASLLRTRRASALLGVALGCLLTTGAAWAKDIALPAKNPAITLTIPDDWNPDERDTQIVAVSPDGDIAFQVDLESRTDREDIVKERKDFLRKEKVNMAVKPAEQTIELGGVPAKLQRYRTTDKTGKTIIDFVTLDASRDRALLVSVWGSELERQANDEALSAIMQSIRVPADTGGGTSFWSGGGKAAAAKPETSKPEAKAETKPETKPEAPPAAAPAPAPSAAQTKPYATRRALYVTRKAANFGDVAARPSNVFAPGEPLLSYIEPVGEATQPLGTDEIRFGVVIDFEVRTSDGKVVGNQKSMLDRDFTMKREYGEPDFYINASLDLDGVTPGDYVLVYTLRDKLSDRTIDVPLPFTIAPAAADKAAAPAPAAPAANPAPAAAPARSTVVDGWTVSLAPEGGVDCTIRYEGKTPREDGKKTATTIAFVSVPGSDVKFTALDLNFSGWNWTKDQNIQANLWTGYFYKYSNLNWAVIDSNSVMIRSTDPEEILKIVKAGAKLGFEQEGKDTVNFEITAPGKALEALKTCRDQQKS